MAHSSLSTPRLEGSSIALHLGNWRRQCGGVPSEAEHPDRRAVKLYRSSRSLRRQLPPDLQRRARGCSGRAPARGCSGRAPE